MSVLVLLIFVSLALAGCFLVAFIWAVRSGQYDDAQTPPMRLLTEEPPSPPAETNSSSELHGDKP
jgi:cbb3-type cytochrome oxidase maturation protein